VNLILASRPGDVDVPNEDYAAAHNNTVVVLDGLTARTESGCIHGVPWYVASLATGILRDAALGPAEALRRAIEKTADSHRDTCDLHHGGTPTAAVAIVQETPLTLRYLVLGDTTIVLDTQRGIEVVTDSRVHYTAPDERAAADALPIGSAEKEQALIRIKHAELAARNVAGGYWAANTDPDAVSHSVVGEVPLAEVQAVALLTDGAARLVEDFDAVTWEELLDTLHAAGPDRVLERVRQMEDSDPAGARWPRNKKSDDATAAYLVPAGVRSTTASNSAGSVHG